MAAAVLGARLHRFRTAPSVLALLWYLSLGPLVIAVSIVLGIWRELPWMLWAAVPVGGIIGIVAVAFLGWSCSSFLDLHERGVVVGRSLLGGAPREMLFTEIHPASLRVFSSIDDIRPFRGASRMISSDWNLAPGADLAVTFVGPDRRTGLGPIPRPPQPGRGIVIFSTPQAQVLAEQLRRGVEAAGCPAHLARWSQQFGVQEIRGIGGRTHAQIPGMHVDWRP